MPDLFATAAPSPQALTLGANYASDPALQSLLMKQRLAASLMGQAGDSSPTLSPLAAFNRALAPALGAMAMKQSNAELGQYAASANQELAAAMQSPDPFAYLANSQNPIARSYATQMAGPAYADRLARSRDLLIKGQQQNPDGTISNITGAAPAAQQMKQAESAGESQGALPAKIAENDASKGLMTVYDASGNVVGTMARPNYGTAVGQVQSQTDIAAAPGAAVKAGGIAGAQAGATYGLDVGKALAGQGLIYNPATQGSAEMPGYAAARGNIKEAESAGTAAGAQPYELQKTVFGEGARSLLGVQNVSPTSKLMTLAPQSALDAITNVLTNGPAGVRGPMSVPATPLAPQPVPLSVGGAVQQPPPPQAQPAPVAPAPAGAVPAPQPVQPGVPAPQAPGQQGLGNTVVPAAMTPAEEAKQKFLGEEASKSAAAKVEMDNAYNQAIQALDHAYSINDKVPYGSLGIDSAKVAMSNVPGIGNKNDANYASQWNQDIGTGILGGFAKLRGLGRADLPEVQTIKGTYGIDMENNPVARRDGIIRLQSLLAQDRDRASQNYSAMSAAASGQPIPTAAPTPSPVLPQGAPSWALHAATGADGHTIFSNGVHWFDAQGNMLK